MKKLYPNESIQSIRTALGLSKDDTINKLFVTADMIARRMWGGGVDGASLCAHAPARSIWNCFGFKRITSD